MKSFIADFLVWWAFKLDPKRFIETEEELTRRLKVIQHEKLTKENQDRNRRLLKEKYGAAPHNHNRDQISERDERLSR